MNIVQAGYSTATFHYTFLTRLTIYTSAQHADIIHERDSASSTASSLPFSVHLPCLNLLNTPNRQLLDLQNREPMFTLDRLRHALPSLRLHLQPQRLALPTHHHSPTHKQALIKMARRALELVVDEMLRRRRIGISIAQRRRRVRTGHDVAVAASRPGRRVQDFDRYRGGRSLFCGLRGGSQRVVAAADGGCAVQAQDVPRVDALHQKWEAECVALGEEVRPVVDQGCYVVL